MNLYQKHRHLIKSGDIMEWSARSLTGSIIRWKTGACVNHTSGALLYELVEGSEHRVCITHAVSKGVVPAFLSNEMNGYKGTIYLVRLKPEYDSYRAAIAREMVRLEGKKYGFWDLFKNLGGPVRIDSKQIFCSEMLHIALIRAKLLSDDFNKGRALVPGQFGETGLYLPPVKIYEGN